ncbi:hypothetical protein VF21_03407 [Pseudogymnoascus sp. 05NY08]|nr:hypothetical protein VF21_03407 [Pseudogymnoascus sp. 05NY08]
MLRKFAFIGSRKRNSKNGIPTELSDAERDLAGTSNISIPSPQPTSPTGVPPSHEPQLQNYNSIANSSFAGSNSHIVASHNQASDQLGLQLLLPNDDPAGDIIFVHGLGGSALRTWSWKRDVANFWPTWLRDEDGLSSFRIFSFGYNANFQGAATNLNTIDFAKDLLFSMLSFSGRPRDGSEGSLPIGSRPIIFVAHSMGGLVVKKAYVLGKHDRQYSNLMAQVYGILFLATPHRGAQYAKILNNILSTVPFGTASKAYVAELGIQSSSLQDINEQFSKFCEELQLASFFETKKTNVGVTKILIVQKDSGILGYPQETSMHLDADHHSICKFESRNDPNYITVKNLLKIWAMGLRKLQRNSSRLQETGIEEMKQLEVALGIRDSAEADLNALRIKVLDGTCQWIISRQEFKNWVEPAPSLMPSIFWIIGQPATGKTALAKSVVTHLKLQGQDCVYYFFSSGHQLKRTAAYCLQSIAFQLAQVNDKFRKHLHTLVKDSGIQFNSHTEGFNLIWEKVFEDILFKLELQRPLFLVLDGINEADSPDFIKCIIKMKSLATIKLFLTSRPTKILLTPDATSLKTTLVLHEEDTADDIRAYVYNTIIDAFPDDPEFQIDIISQILEKASGSFLWVKLALERLEDNCHTKDDIQKELNEVPKGMEPLYQQMLDIITAQLPRTQLMAKRILTWATCCWRPLSVAELQIALQPEFQGFINLENTIIQICGHFISVDNSTVAIVHPTAGSFLLHDRGSSPPYINPHEGHEHISMVCLNYLSSDRWRIILKDYRIRDREPNPSWEGNQLSGIEKTYPLFGYATIYWAYHVSISSCISEELRIILEAFLKKYSLSWIEAIAVLGDMRNLTRSAQYLKGYAKKICLDSNVDVSDRLLSLHETPNGAVNMLGSWANDFIHIAGKFGGNLSQHPSSIYRLVPPLCPQQSMVGIAYRVSDSNSVSVAGLPPDEGWSDCLASVNIGEETSAYNVLATDAYFITLVSIRGTVVIWHAETCEEARRIDHTEYVTEMELNRAGTRLATLGHETYRVWDISSGKELYRLPKTAEERTMTVAFGPTDSELLIGLDNCSVTCYDLETLLVKSRWVAQDSLYELRGCPLLMSISPDLRKIAMAWKGTPLMVWDLTQPQPPQKCRVTGFSDPLSAPKLVKWQPDGNSVVILCFGTEIFEWDLYKNKQTEYSKSHNMNTTEMAISADGSLLLTSSNTGTISVWALPRMQLIYQLVNMSAHIWDITFSPNGQRFYDTRDSVCNVWEPDALVRLDVHDHHDISNLTERFATTEPVIRDDESSESQISAFAIGPDDMYYCCGKEDGSVTIHEATEGTKVRKVYGYGATSTVILLAWSKSGRYMVSCDDSGHIISKRLEVKIGGKWAVFPGLDMRIRSAISQFVFSNDEKLLLISTSMEAVVWDLKRKIEICSKHHDLEQISTSLLMSQHNWKSPGAWIAHPTNAELILFVSDGIACSYKWTTLEQSDFSCLPQIVDPLNTSKVAVSKLALTKDGMNMVYEATPSQRSDGLLIPTLATLPIDHWKRELPYELKKLIGTFQDRIVFLDRDYWLCTWKVDADFIPLKRHFFLPKHWLNTSSLEMATLNEHGTFFCPRFGKVIIIRNGMLL